MVKTSTKSPFWYRWGPALAVMAAIFIFSSIPSHSMPNFGAYDFSVKKLGHMTGYALLATFYLRGIGKTGWRAFAAAWLMAIAYAATDEFHQSFVAGRGSTIFDVGIDALGALVGLGANLAYIRRNRTSGYHSPNSSSKSSF